jgi:putative flippase GtrA
VQSVVGFAREKLGTPLGQKLFRYSMTSVVAVVVSNACILFFVGVLNMGVIWASTLSTTIATIPSYHLNRKWAWGKGGKSHLWKEVIPFWALALLGWAFSTVAVAVADNFAKHHDLAHTTRTLLIGAVYFCAFGVLWVGKFVIFNRLMFVPHSHHSHHGDAQRASLVDPVEVAS